MNEFTRVPKTGLDLSGHLPAEVSPAWMRDQRVLIFIADHAEAEAFCSEMQKAEIVAKVCADKESFRKEISAGAGLALVERNILTGHHWKELVFPAQTAWCDFPVIMLVNPDDAESPVIDESRAHFLLLPRPVPTSALVNIARTLLHAHRRQCELGFQLSKSARRQEALQAREDLQRERDFSDVAINCLPGLFYASDVNGYLLRWNKAIEEVTGYSAGEVARMHAFEFFPPEQRPLIAGRIAEVFTIGESSVDAPLLTKSGAQIPYFFTGKRCIVDGQQCLIGMGVDVTEQKATEIRLRELHATAERHAEELEHRVAERTRNLQASVQSLEGVLYHVAHDLRAPLRAMQGFTTILLEECTTLSPEGMDYARRIAVGASRMDKLIHDLLAYGRLAHATLRPARLDLNREVQNALAHFADEINSRHAVVQVNNPLLEVYADEKILGLLLVNLLSNAIHFVARDTQPRIGIKTERVGAGTVRLSITDNGIGIAPGHQERIFRVFERLHTGGVSNGTGIGLAIVRKGVERMGGAAGVESNLGAGSRFWLDLPAEPKNE